MKATAHTATIVTRSGIGRTETAQLTDADRQAIHDRRDAQAARLARIAARRNSNN